MREIQIRPAIGSDLPSLMEIDHSCQTDYVWQMEMQREEGQFGATFREIRLPGSVSIEYPRQVTGLSESWNRRSGILAAVLGGQVVGYIKANDTNIPRTAWLMDLAVAPRYRRQGIASSLILAAQSWGVQRNDNRAIMEMISKNYPAIRLAQKLGYDFCGYNDQYYETQDISLFFGRQIR